MRPSIVSLLSLLVSARAFAQDPAPEEPPAEEPVPAEAVPGEAVPGDVVPVEPAPVEPPPAPTTGTVTGTVTDADGIPFPGLSLNIGDAPVTTDAEGRFTVTLDPGDYPVRVNEAGLFAPGDLVATVAAGGVTTVDIPLRTANPDEYTVVVYAPEVVGGVNASIDQRKEAPAVTEVIGAEQMTKSGDSNASSALSRVTGLTIVNGRFVYVRGMGDRYSSTLLNMSTLPSPEPERRVVPLDLFPTGLLEQVTIYKTWTPDLPGEFGGGAVSLKTRGIPDDPYTQITLTGGYTSQTSLMSVASGARGPTDWLGFGLAPREIPAPLAAATQDQRLSESNPYSQGGVSADELETIGESIDPAYWAGRNIVLPPDLGIQLGFGRKIEFGKAKLGVTLGATYNNTWGYDEYTERDFAENASESRYVYDFTDLSNNVILGGLANLGLKIGDQGIYYTGLLTRSSTYNARTYDGFNGDLNGDLRSTLYEWTERQLQMHQVRGEHTFSGLGDFGVDWRYAYSEAALDQPDQREYRYDYVGDTDELAISTRQDATSLLFSNLRDQNHDARLDLHLPFGSTDRQGRLSAGGQLVMRDRAAATRRFGLVDLTPNPDVLPLPIEEQFTPENIGPDGYKLIEVTRTTDSYSAHQEIQAGYAMVDFPFDAVAHTVKGLRDLSVLAGARVEHAETTVDTFEEFVEDPDVVRATLNNTDILPSVTITQSFLKPAVDPDDDTLQLRLGWARTVTRPDFRELSPAVFNTVFGGRQLQGNPDLVQGTIDHWDARIEWYPAKGELLSLGGFYKSFEDPIETQFIPGATPAQTWQNAVGATNMGLELDLRKTLFGTGSAFLDRMYVAANGSLIRSRVDLGAGGQETDQERALEGQSPWVLNAQIGYDNTDTKSIATVSFNVAGPRIVAVGIAGVPNTIEQPVPRLDLLLQQGVGDFYVRVRGRNLLNPAIETTAGETVIRSLRDGWQALVSLEYRP